MTHGDWEFIIEKIPEEDLYTWNEIVQPPSSTYRLIHHPTNTRMSYTIRDNTSLTEVAQCIFTMAIDVFNKISEKKKV